MGPGGFSCWHGLELSTLPSSVAPAPSTALAPVSSPLLLFLHPLPQPRTQHSSLSSFCRQIRTTASNKKNNCSPVQKSHQNRAEKDLQNYFFIPPPGFTVERPKPGQVTSNVLGLFAQGPDPLSSQMVQEQARKLEPSGHGQCSFCLVTSMQ